MNSVERAEKYQHFITDLIHAHSYDAAYLAYSDYIQALGLKSMSYVFMPDSPFQNHTMVIPRFSVTADFSHTFLEEYAACNFQHHDYIVKAVNEYQSNQFLLWEEDRKSGRLSTQSARLINKARDDYGMGNGCSILTSRSAPGVGAITVIGDETDKAFTQYMREIQGELTSISEIFHNHILARGYETKAFVIPVLLSDLNKTEKKVLKLLLDGLSVPQIAQAISRSRGYVENLVRDTRIKMGGLLPNGKPAISKDHLIHFCGIMRIYAEL